MEQDLIKFINNHPQEHAEWKQLVASDETVLGFEDWMADRFNVQMQPRIVHFGSVITSERSRAACGVSYQHPGHTFTTTLDHVTCLRCRGTHRFHNLSVDQQKDGAGK